MADPEHITPPARPVEVWSPRPTVELCPWDAPVIAPDDPEAFVGLALEVAAATIAFAQDDGYSRQLVLSTLVQLARTVDAR